eukprot:4033457-Pleurochrysis_carterae.AAC.1
MTDEIEMSDTPETPPWRRAERRDSRIAWSSVISHLEDSPPAVAEFRHADVDDATVSSVRSDADSHHSRRAATQVAARRAQDLVPVEL